jgi:hypothetical protein
MIYGNDKLRYSFEREFDEYKLYFSYPIEWLKKIHTG